MLRTTAIGATALAGATAIVALLQDILGVPNPSAVYILAVAVAALAGGRGPCCWLPSLPFSSTTICSSTRVSPSPSLNLANG
jgi:K+-sensing histidine kinase KdpD